jgi:hypothetical protein
MLSSIPYLRKWILPAMLIVLVVFIAFSELLTRPPGGMHFVRQTDVLAFVEHYRLLEAPWYQPGILNLNTENGKAICEMPIFYFLISKLTTDAAQAAAMIRWTMLLVMCSAILRLHWILRKCAIPYSEWLLILAFSSGVLWYYTISIVPEIMALSCCLWGISYVIESYYLGEFKQRSAFAMLIWFTLASWLKITYSLFPIAIICTLVFCVRNLYAEKWYQRALLIGLAHLVLVFLWYAYARWYAHEVGDEYFLLRPRPLWEAPQQEWRELLTWPWRVWGNIFMHWQIKSAVLLSVGYGLVNNRKSSKYLMIYLLFAAIGCVAFLILFAVHLRDHDYYLLLLLPFVLSVFIWGAGGLPQKGWRSWYVHLSCGLTFLMVGQYTYRKVNDRIERRYTEYTVIYDALRMDMEVVKNLLNAKNATPILIGDASYNGGLVALESFGWTTTISDWNRQRAFFWSKYMASSHLIFLKRDKHLIEFLPSEFERVEMETQAVEVWQRKPLF